MQAASLHASQPHYRSASIAQQSLNVPSAALLSSATQQPKAFFGAGINRVTRHLLNPGQWGGNLHRFTQRLLGDQIGMLQKGQILSLNLSELPLAGLASGILLYITGQEIHKADTGQPYAENRWAKILGEGSVLYGILATTKNLYPVLGGGLLAYTWGKADSILKKVYSTVDIVTSLLASAAGVLFGLGVQSSAQRYDFKKLHHYLNSQPLQTALQNFEGELTDGMNPRQTLAYLNPLKQKANELLAKIQPQIAITNRELAQLSNTQHPLSGTEKSTLLKKTEDFITHLRPLTEPLEKELMHQASRPSADQGLKKLLEFTHHIKRSSQGYVRMARSLNPIFGAIIFGTIAQAIISKPIKALVGKLFPQLNGINIEMPERTFLFDNAHRRPRGHTANMFDRLEQQPHFDFGRELNHHLIDLPPGHQLSW